MDGWIEDTFHKKIELVLTGLRWLLLHTVGTMNLSLTFAVSRRDGKFINRQRCLRHSFQTGGGGGEDFDF